MTTINDYHVDPLLIGFWERNSLKNMYKKNKDKVYIIDGMERSGKSTFAIQQACVIEPSLLENPDKLCSRIVFSAEDFNKICRETKNGVIIFDEAFRGFASRSSMSRVNKKLIQTLMEMGQNNNIVFIVLPRVFMLDIYPAMLRSNALFNIYESRKDGKRHWRYYCYNDKNKIYQAGIKKGWNYIFDSKINGRFFGKFPGGEEFNKAYLAKKAIAFKGVIKSEDEYELLAKEVNNMHKMGMTYEKIAEIKGFSTAKARFLCVKAKRATTLD